MEKAANELEKAVAGQRREGEGGRRAADRRNLERDQGGCPRSGMVEMLAVGPPATVGNAEAARRSTSARAAVIFSRKWRQHATIRNLWTKGYDY